MNSVFFSSSVEPPAINVSINPSIFEDEDIMIEDVVPPVKGRVYLLNDEIHSFDDVIRQVILAINCGVKKAQKIAETVHMNGKCMVKEGNIDECLEVSAVLEEIQLITQIIM